MPFPVRFMTGLLKPKIGIPGFDVAGEIEAIGTHGSTLQPGDHVFGPCQGGCAEFVAVKHDLLVRKPAKLTFEQAAALPTSGLAALQAMRDVGAVRPSHKVLINGASGGVGTFAVQIAKSLGADVTGVCSARNVAMVRALGADHVIDYTAEDFTRSTDRYDLILDNVENRSLSECRRVLAQHGMLIVNSGSGAQGLTMLMRLMKPLVISPFVRQELRRFVSVPNHVDLKHLKELVESGKLTPVIDRTYPLDDTVTALKYIDSGHARGKVIIRVAPAEENGERA
jgi:NADPH:quinone reductase-like Zn-dependent oxidoreductase